MKDKFRTFGAVVSSAILLILAKGAAALGKIPLCSVLGAENSGVYYAVFPLYGLGVSLSSGGITACVSAATSRLTADGGNLSHSAIKKTACFTTAATAAAAALIFIFAPAIAAAQHIPSAVSLYRVMAPGVVFCGLSSVFKGWLLGNRKFTLTAASELLTQVLKSAAGVGGALLVRGGGATAAAAAVTLSECCSFAATAAAYLRVRKKTSPLSSRRDGDAKDIMIKSIPLTAGGVILPLCSFIESFIVLNLLGEGAGFTAEYGINEGAVGSLLSLPVSVFHAMASYFLPYLSGKDARKDFTAAVGAFLSAGVLFFITYVVMPGSIIQLLFPALPSDLSEKAALLLAVGAVSMPAAALTHAFTTLFQSCGKTWLCTAIKSFAAVIRIILVVALALPVGIRGCMLAQVVSSAVAAAACIFSAARLGAFINVRRLVLPFFTAAAYCLSLVVCCRLFDFSAPFTAIVLPQICAFLCAAVTAGAGIALSRRVFAKKRN